MVIVRRVRLFSVVLAGFLVACSTLNPLTDDSESPGTDGGDGSGAARNGDSMEIAAAAGNVMANGNDRATLEIAVSDSAGQPREGVRVWFFAPEQLAYARRDSLTGASGQARASFTAAEPGAYRVAVAAAAGDDTLRDSATLSFSDVNATVSIEAVTLSADSIYLNDAAEVEVRVYNRAQTAPLAGQTVRFSLADPRMGTIEDSVISDSGGRAAAVFASGLLSGQTTITIEAGGMYRSVPIQIVGGEGTPSDIELVAEPWRIAVRGAGGTSRAELRFTVVDKRGNPVGERHRAKLRVSVIQGPGGGVFLSDTIVYTNPAGQATSVLNAGIKSGNVVVKCELLDESLPAPVSIERSVVTITGGPPDENHFHIVKELRNIWAWDYAGNTNTITAYVGDRYGNPVPAGYVVNFFTTGGMIEGAAITDERGVASVELVGQGADAIDDRAYPDSTDFAPLRDDIDPRHFLRPADQTMQGAPRSVERFVLKDDSVLIPPVNLRGETRRTGDGQAIVFASVSNDSSHYGCETCQSKLLWSQARVVFSGKPYDYSVYNVRINGVRADTAEIPNEGKAAITCSITDINGNPLVGGTTFSVETELDNITIGHYVTEMPDAEAGYSSFAVTIADDDTSVALNRPATVTSRNGGSVDGLAPRPARITGSTDQTSFRLAGGRAEVWSGEVPYGPGIAGLELKLTVDAKSAVVTFDAADTSVSNVVGRLSRELDSICGIQQRDGRIRLYSFGFGDTSHIRIEQSSAANYLGFVPGDVYGSLPDTLYLEVNQSLYTITFAPGDTTLRRIAQRISSAAGPVIAGVHRDEGGRGTLEIRTTAAGSDQSLRPLSSSTMLDKIGVIGGIDQYAYGQDPAVLIVAVDGGAADTIVFQQQDTTVIEALRTIRASGPVGADYQDGEISLRSPTIGNESSIQVLEEGSTANKSLDFPTTIQHGSEIVTGNAGDVYLTIDHPGITMRYFLAHLIFR